MRSLNERCKNEDVRYSGEVTRSEVVLRRGKCIAISNPILNCPPMPRRLRLLEVVQRFDERRALVRSYLRVCKLTLTIYIGIIIARNAFIAE